MQKKLVLVIAVVLMLLCPARVLLAQTNGPEAKVTMHTIYVHSPTGDTLVPEEAKTIMLSKKFVGATVDALGLTNRWHVSKSDACERIVKSLQVERTTDRYNAVVRMVDVDSEDAVQIINQLCFLLANCNKGRGNPSTEDELRSLAATNCTPTYLYRRTAEIGRTNTALIVVNEYAQGIEQSPAGDVLKAAPEK